MNLAPYRQVFALPGMRLLMIFGMLARIPVTAAALTLTLHVVTDLGLKFTEAGIAGAAAMVGVGIGSPVLGRIVDRIGMRPVMVVTVIAQGIYWAAAPSMPYAILVIAAFISGVLSIPIFSVMRQFVAAMVPVEHRRTAYAMDTMAVEVSYMVGPALAVACVTSFGSSVTMYGVGLGIVLAGIGLIVMNLPIRSAEEEETDSAPVPRRQWLRPSMISLLAATAATTFVLSSTELAIVAVMKADDATKWTGLVIGIWCVYSLVGGFVYGALHRSVSPLLIVGALSALTIPLALVSGGWWWFLLALIPAGVLCAPALASSVDTLSQWVPASARGEAMGLHGTALTVGIAMGAPFTGAIIDGLGPQWGFIAAGATGLLIAVAAVPLWRRNAPVAPAPPAPAPAPVPPPAPVTTQAVPAVHG